MRKLCGKARQEVRRRLFRYVAEQTASENYNYIIGFVEQRMPEIKSGADLIRDLYGAYFYSADKVQILDLYYSKFKKNSKDE